MDHTAYLNKKQVIELKYIMDKEQLEVDYTIARNQKYANTEGASPDVIYIEDLYLKKLQSALNISKAELELFIKRYNVE
jgi:hypothetical protein